MRPRVVCHMVTSVDGRVVVDGWPRDAARSASGVYEAIHSSYDADGGICGRVTMEAFAGAVRPAEGVDRVYGGGEAREDFTAPGDHDSFAFALDSQGKLDWTSNEISGDHVVAIVSHRVSDDYLASLRQRGVSYLLAGSDELDLGLALEKTAARFGVETLMLEGGGRINGAMIAAGLVDEVSVLVAPVVDGRMGTAALFDAGASDDFEPGRLTLVDLERRDEGVVWLRYSVATA